jgi:quercetin dioxygenase-like cupin family protein
MNAWSKALVLGAALAAIGVVAIARDEAPHANRQILQRQDVSGTAKEAVIGTADLPGGVAIGRHTHPGEEVGYVLKGPVLMRVQGRSDVVLQAGDSYVIPAGVPHDAEAQERSGAKVVATWVVDKGQPLSTPAK